MSIAAVAASFDVSDFWTPSGVSPESEEIRDFENAYRTDRQKPASSAWRDLLIEQIGEIVQSCSGAGWDGYDADPVSLDSALTAIAVAQGLPEGVQAPAAVPEPGGDIAFEWRTGHNQIFSLSATDRTLVYAGRFGGQSRKYGEEPFFGVIPQTIREILASYFPAA